MQESLNKLLPEIYSHMEKEAPREGCGLIVQKSDEIKFISVENKSEDENSFYIDPKEYVRHSIISKILYVVHQSRRWCVTSPSKCQPLMKMENQTFDRIFYYPHPNLHGG